MLGISFDGPGDNLAFAKKFEFPYPLLSDESRAAGLAYGAYASVKPVMYEVRSVRLPLKPTAP